MKQIITFLVAVLCTVILSAQSSEKMSYQAVVRDASNTLVKDKVVGIKFTILKTNPAGLSVYTETQTPTTNNNGMLSIQVGGDTGFSEIDWSNDNYFIKTEIDPLGGSNYTLVTTSQLLSVPYALHAKTADSFSNAINKSEVFDAISPLTTAGDIIYGGINGTGTRLAIGTENQVLTTNGTGNLSWETPITGATNLDGLSDARYDSDNFSLYLGLYAGNVSTGLGNTVYGFTSLYFNTIGNYNTVIGYDAGNVTAAFAENSNPSRSIFLGAGTRALVDYGIDEVVIGSFAVGNGSNTVTIGNSSNIANYFKGDINLAGASATGAKLSLNEPSGDGTNTVSIQSQAIAEDYTLTLPVNAGTANQVLTTNGTGNLSWSTPAITDGSETKVTAGTNITITGSGTTASPYVVDTGAKISLNEPSGDGINKVTIQSQAIASDYTLTLPVNAGTYNQVLTTDGTGNLSWSNNYPSFNIGQLYQGGVIFWLDATKRHGLIAALADQSEGIKWLGGYATITRARADGIRAGLKNTAIAIACQVSVGGYDGFDFAATVCNEYSVTWDGITYADWYLPSKHELSLLFSQRNVLGGLAQDYYWSSTEYNQYEAWTLHSNGGGTHAVKSTNYRVRAIRAF